ncbi:hypothetical protein [Variovorax sp. PCZ-1]|uniref:hypothetical protein n=1 Tax=Variovorax sp. PCZ-1 TaxID=2835533 RepID=UPI001BD17D86|nr:hypothetical protein [Variovorax sp. PCZ-1]MBS7806987.1 hypothetical protein [Variovorax sp. PCZ-1]
MTRLIFSFSRFRTAALATCCLVGAAFAQEANVLGLPAIPQPKPGAAAAGPAKSASAAPEVAASRDILAGELGLQHSALNGQGRLIITTRAMFATAGAKSAALDAARGVQLELSKACGKQCKPEKMSAPKILPTGQMEFELAFRPLYQHLNQTQFLAALQSKPLNLTPAQLAPPAAIPTSVTASPTASAPASTKASP